MAGRIVQCPVCHTQLHEPPGAPYFTCVCGTVLQSSILPPPGPPPPLPATNGYAPPPSYWSASASSTLDPPDMSSLSLQEPRPSSSSSNPPAPPPPKPQYHQCSTCGGFLNLPENLPRDKQGNRLVRCGSCQAVNRIPDPEPESLPEPLPPQGGPPPLPPQQNGSSQGGYPLLPPQQNAPPQQTFEPPRRRPFAYEQAPVESNGRPSSAYSEEQEVYSPPPPPPPIPAPYPERLTSPPQYFSGPPPRPLAPHPERLTTPPHFFSGPAAYPPPRYHSETSLPLPHQPPPGQIQYQYSMPPSYHEAGPIQPGSYPGDLPPPGVAPPPPASGPSASKRKTSFFGKIKKSVFHDVDEFERDVKVNGFPVPDSQVKKAESRAGPIEAGDYWYDVRAGFWGLMDGPTLNIIPAGIHELVRNKKSEEEGGSGVNELQRHFSKGDTDVIINGRELAQRDLTMLKSRGVSAERRAYWLDISGQLTDAVTNQPIMNLGHLAVSLAQGNRGLGMRIPEDELRRRNIEEMRKALQEHQNEKPIVARVSNG